MSKQVKIILPENIEKIGKKWDTKEVKAGFYHNCAWLREKVWLDNLVNRRRRERIQQQEQAAALLKAEKAQETYQKINNWQLKFTLQKDKHDKVLGSVRLEDILNELKSAGFLLKKKQILDFAPLTSLGDNGVKIKLGENLIARIKITITASE